MKHRFSASLARVLSILVILLISNASVWASQVVMEESHDPGTVVSAGPLEASHADDSSRHVDASRDKPLQGIDCDHSCHASAHFLALACTARPLVATGGLTLSVAPVYHLPESPADPPFIPPIA